MNDEYYDVIFHNTVPEAGKQNLAGKIAARFNISKEKSLQLLSINDAVCLKKKVDLNTALKYKSAFNKLELQCEVINHQDNDEKPFIEKRGGERRSGKDRRAHYRASAVQPDRRMKDRRS